MPRPILKLRNQFWEVWQLTFTDFGILASQRNHINSIKGTRTCVTVPGTVSGYLRSSAPHVRSVRKKDMIRRRHFRDGFLKAQGTSTFAIVILECPKRYDKVTNHLRVRGIQYRATSDSYLTS